jgi:hypothetical protein
VTAPESSDSDKARMARENKDSDMSRRSPGLSWAAVLMGSFMSGSPYAFLSIL